MHSEPRHAIEGISVGPGELSFEAHIGGTACRIWFRTDAPVTPTADAALAACLLPAMRSGGTLRLESPISPRILRTQREFQAIQCAWSLEWQFGYPPLREVEVLAPVREPDAASRTGRIATFFSGGVDSWSTILEHPELTDLIFLRGFDLLRTAPQHVELIDVAERRLREAAEERGLRLHVVETNIRELSDPFADWETYYGCALVAVALFLAPLFDRVLIAGDSDHEVQEPFGANRMIDQLWSTEQLEIVDDGGRYSRVERVRRIVDDPLVQRTLRVCWENRDGKYNCGRCRKCLMTMLTLEALGARGRITTFPEDLDLAPIAEIDIAEPVLLTLWEDVLDAARANGRPDLEKVLERAVQEGKRRLGLPPSYRRRRTPGPPPTVRIAVIVPVWRQPQFLATAVQSALHQEIGVGVGVVIVNDGCPYKSTDRVAQTLRDANPDRVAYVRQENGGVSSARNTGVRRALWRWPHLEAIFPLDADNQLSPQTLAHLWAMLEECPDAAWVTPAQELFGAEAGEWRMTEPYLPYRQLFVNQSDTGSLIRRSVFGAGVEFDETMGAGYEDWEFFLHATQLGFRGEFAGSCGFRYRRRSHSMVMGATRQDHELRAGLRRLHPSAYAPRALTRREHNEAPRFALVKCDAGEVILTASLDLPGHHLPLSVFAERIRSSGGGAWPIQDPVPAITVLTTTAAVEWLEARGLLPGTLLRLQLELRQHPAVGVRITEGKPDSLELTPSEPTGAPSSAIAYRTRTLTGHPPAPTLMLSIHAGLGPPPALAQAGLHESVAADLRRGARTGTPLLTAPSHPRFFETHHIDELDTTLPWSGTTGGPVLLVLAPWLGSSGTQPLASALVRAAKALDHGLSAHLLLMTRGIVEADVETSLAPFDTLTPLAGTDAVAASRLINRLMSGADIVLHAGASDGLIVLPELEPGQRGRQIVIATTSSPLPHVDEPELLAVRCYEPWIDAYLATSTAAAATLENLGAVPDKIIVCEAPWESAARTLLGALEMAG